MGVEKTISRALTILTTPPYSFGCHSVYKVYLIQTCGCTLILKMFPDLCD